MATSAARKIKLGRREYLGGNGKTEVRTTTIKKKGQVALVLQFSEDWGNGVVQLYLGCQGNGGNIVLMRVVYRVGILGFCETKVSEEQESLLGSRKYNRQLVVAGRAPS